MYFSSAKNQRKTTSGYTLGYTPDFKNVLIHDIKRTNYGYK